MTRNEKSKWFAAEMGMLLSQAWILLYFLCRDLPLNPGISLFGTLIIPGFNIGLLLFRGKRFESFVFSLCFAPLCAGVTGALIGFLDLSPLLGGLAPVLLTMPLAGAAGFFDQRGDEKDKGALPAMLLCCGVMLLTALMLLLSVRLRLSWHGLLHSSIAYQIMEGKLPPENPFYAGEPLIYYWAYHLAAAGMSWVSGLSPLYSFAILNIMALGAVFPCIYLISRSFRLSPGAAIFSALIGALAMNPFGPLLLLLQDSPVSLSDLAQGQPPAAFLTFMTMNFDFRLASPLTKFWNVSSFGPAIPLFLFSLYLVVKKVDSLFRSSALLCLTVAGLILMNPLAGALFCVGAGAASLIWLNPEGRKQFLTIWLGTLLGCMLCAPYLLDITGGANNEPFLTVGFSSSAVLGVLYCAGPVLLLAGIGSIDQIRKKRKHELALLVFCLCLTVLALVIHFPEGNEYKIIRLLVFSCGALAAAPALLLFKKLGVHAAIGVVLAGLFLLPNTTIAVTSYLMAAQCPASLADSEQQIVLLSTTNQREEVYRFIREKTPEDAVIVVNPDDRMHTVGGYMQGDEVPAMTRRNIYTGHDFYLTEGYSDLQDRLFRAYNLFKHRGGPYPERVYSRPLYLLVRSKIIPDVLKSSLYTEVFRNQYNALYLQNK